MLKEDIFDLDDSQSDDDEDDEVTEELSCKLAM